MIEPGSYKTQLADSSLIKSAVEKHWRDLPEDVQESYTASYYHNFTSHLGVLANNVNPNIVEVIDAMADAVIAQSPQLRYVPGTFGSKLRGLIIPLLPLWIQDRVLSRLSIDIPGPSLAR